MRVALLNVESGAGTTRGYWEYPLRLLRRGTRHIERAADVLAAREVDVAAACEVDGGSRRTRGVDQAALLAGRSGLAHRIFFPTFSVGRRVHQGNLLLSRGPLRRIEHRRLPGTTEPRYLCGAEVELDGGRLRVFVTHLSLKLVERSRQLAAIEEAVASERGPTVLAGDFNVTRAAEIELLARTPLRGVASGATFPAWRPRRRLDYVFFSDHFVLGDVSTEVEEPFADHLPLVVDLEWR